MRTYRAGVKKTPKTVTPIIPANTAAPTDWRLAAPAPVPAESPAVPAGTTISVNLDGYYSYNFNRPVGQVNLLRAYDVTANSFNLNQAGLILERAPDAELLQRRGEAAR